MLEELYLFTRGLWSFKYDVPIPLQITAYIVFLVIITGLMFVFKESLDTGPYRDSYMWYYMIAVFNIINIVAVLYYYHTKSGTYIGPSGEIGDAGTHGKRGNNISCNLCSQNIYLQKTTGYDMITELNFVRLANIIVGEDLAQSLNQMNSVMGPARRAFFDFSELGNHLAAGTFDFSNPVVANLLLLSTYADYPLIQYINQVLGLSIPGGQAGTLERPAKKLGHFALGDIAFGGSEKYSVTAYMANGDIRCPQGFSPICSFITSKGGEDREGEIDYYTIYKMQPPILSSEDMRIGIAESDLTRRVTDDEYVSLGHVAYFQKPEGEPADPLLFACVRKSCCERVSTDKLRFICVYPGVSGGVSSKVTANTNAGLSSNNLKKKRAETTINRNANEGYFSIWRTPMNTMMVKFSNSAYEDGLYLPEIMYEVDENIYEQDGTIKAKIRNKIKIFLSRVKLDQVIVATCIFGATLEQVKQDLRVFVNRFCSGPAPEILPTEALLSSGLDMTPAQVSQALADIQIAIDDADSVKSTQPKPRRRKDLKTLFAEPEAREQLPPSGISYNARKAYKNMKELIGLMTARIENARNLWDVIQAVLPQGLTARIYKAELTPTQSRLIDLITVLVPPTEDVWMIKDECLILERLDKTRMEWEGALEEAIGEHKKLVRDANRREEGTDPCGDIKAVNKAVEESIRLIGLQVGHIPDYMGLLYKSDFSQFTEKQIQGVLGILRQINNKIRSNCGV